MDWSWSTFTVTALLVGPLGFLAAALLTVAGRTDAVQEARWQEREATLAMVLERLDRIGAAQLAVQEAQWEALMAREAKT